MLRIASLQLPTSVGMKAKSPLQMLARFAQQSKQLPQLWASRGWRQRVVQIKRWTMMGTLIASLAFVALWLVDLLGASDREMMLAFRTTPALAPDNEVLPHLLDGDPLPLKLSLRLNTPPSRNATHVSLP
jgi:hypothetical protein